MIDTLLLRPSLHFTSSHLNFTQLRFITISFSFNPFRIPAASFQLTSLYFTSLHCNFRRFSPHFYSFHFTPFIIAFLKKRLKVALWGFFNTAVVWPIVFLPSTSSPIRIQRRHASYRCARPLPAKAGTITNEFC